MRATLYSASWVLPVTAPPIRCGALLVNPDGLIESVGPLSAFDSLVDIERRDFGNTAIMPGLINVHAHPELSAFRGLLEDLPFHEWIPSLMRCKHGAALTPDDYAVAARWTCVESLRAGATTLGATEDSGAAVQALAHAGMRGLIYLETFGPAPAQAEQAIHDLRKRIAGLTAATSDRVRLGVSPHAPYTVSDELFARVASFAKSEQLPVATHAAEAEVEELLVREGLGPFAAGLRSRGIPTSPRGTSTIDLLARTGLLDCAPLLIHAVRLSDSDMQLVGDSGSAIAHCPIANGRLGHGIARIVEARERGIRVGLGTDSVASNNRLDLLEEAHFAQTLQRARLHSTGALCSQELLELVTIDGARVLGVDDRTGSLEKGKDADFCVVSLDGAHVAPVPVSDPLAALFHACRGSDVRATAVQGKLLYDNGRITTLNEAELREQIDAIAQRLCRVRDAHEPRP